MAVGTSVPILGQASGSSFVRFTIEVGQGANPTTWTTIRTSTSQITSAYGTLATWNTANLSGQYSIRLTVTASATVSDTRTVRLGWPQYVIQQGAFAPMISTPAFGDIDSTYPGQEVVVVASEGDGGASNPTYVYIWHADGSSVSGWNPKVIAENYLSSSPVYLPAPAVGDVNNDGQLDVVVTTQEKVHIFNRDGSYLSAAWPKPIEYSTGPGAVIADLDGNGTLEVLIASFLDRKFYIWKHDGTSLGGSWPKVTSQPIVSAPSVGNLDADTNLEIVITEGKMVRIWNTDGTSLSAAWPKTVSGASYVRPSALADIDQDGNAEIVVGGGNSSSQGVLYAYETNGASVIGSWPRTFPRTFDGFAIGDLDQTTRNLEIVLAPKETAYVYALNFDGSDVQGGWPFENPY